MKIICDIGEKKTYFDKTEGLDSYSILLSIGFRDNKKLPVFFTNMSFKFSLTNEEEFIEEGSFPTDGAQLVSTDEEYSFISELYYLYPDKEYTLTFWIENNEESWEDSINFVLPRPDQPFPSWNYNEEEFFWEPPIPIPDDLQPYYWDEDSQSWIFEIREIGEPESA